MKEYTAHQCDYTILLQNGNPIVYPYLLCDSGDKTIWNVSPNHGRSFVMCHRADREWVVCKGNGLNYSSFQFLNTGEMKDDTWGLLLRKDAVRDFLVGNEIRGLGIKTNYMEAVLEIDDEVLLPTKKRLHPILLQYVVECPYRIEDFAFMPHDLFVSEISRWEQYNAKGYKKKHLIAADVLIRNLRTLHDNKILHNALHIGNYTWALELLDFELSCTPKYPYDSEDYQRHVMDMYDRETVFTYVIINYISHYLQEDIDHREIDALFQSYGYDLKKYQVPFM